ncbi:nucleolar protein 12-domain-containing protein [Annulohypoxylon maeteangense]|uniref:nucleolar protein 12-domain-containing protein n=1 Tax=Annulohypoxylon maeteangense TaxID=1927788 RepID=UPI002007E7A8|nr:nucleolar protein 12-domain-containing protein [Annulohypoxylon maeteangense]KAI0885246.1 nucleolar protein 12-domain-containing protein [Annulohypoxylon maeteangense]
MFARPRPKKGLLPPPPKKRKVQHSLEEIKFDNDARSDYLTGFHKRKLQRIKNAQEQASQRARQEKIEFRKQIREERKREVEEHVQNVNAILKEAQQAGYVGEETAEDEAEEWGGFQDTLAPEPIDHEEEYIDEERYTTVTIESVNVSKDGLTSSRPEESSGEEDEDDAARRDSQHPPGSQEKTRPPKKKKPKFRYETKSERQLSQRKQKASKSRKKPRD